MVARSRSSSSILSGFSGGIIGIPDPLIVTAQFDADRFALFEALRRRYFPPARNLIDAHLTLFHHLPGTELVTIGEELMRVCSDLAPMEFTVTKTHFLGGGVALAITCPALTTLRSHLAASWSTWLTAQDRQTIRPHVTVQNKVTANEARRTEADLQEMLPLQGVVTGLLLWHYRGGPWERAAEFAFRRGRS